MMIYLLFFSPRRERRSKMVVVFQRPSRATTPSLRNSFANSANVAHNCEASTTRTKKRKTPSANNVLTHLDHLPLRN